MKNFWKIPFKNLFVYFRPTSSPLSDEQIYIAQSFMLFNLN